MCKPSNVVKNGVSGHLDYPPAVGPSKVLVRFMVEDIGYENTFLAVADRTGNPAVVTVYAIGKIGA